MFARWAARRRPQIRASRWDPGRELRAERRARELLRSVVSAREAEAYERLGFISVPGNGDPASGYAYLIYPHRPLIAYDTRTRELLCEYCVGFPDRSEAEFGQRLPDSDDVLAKWMALRGGERDLIAAANMHLPGRQVDPQQVRRDLVCLREWQALEERRRGPLEERRRGPLEERRQGPLARRAA
ncbi:MAG: hypothetical protein GEU88_08175 [Solirubrobacterales bacterium]|nr:hypothetical protein [Solirubrobacterales bacterium]